MPIKGFSNSMQKLRASVYDIHVEVSAKLRSVFTRRPRTDEDVAMKQSLSVLECNKYIRYLEQIGEDTDFDDTDSFFGLPIFHREKPSHDVSENTVFNHLEWELVL